MGLSACLIVRNEQDYLAECLFSLRGQVDELVVVDTGSVDKTKDLAAGFGAKLFEFSWIDDFSAARNYALDKCNGDWIFYIDADERLAPTSAGAVKAALHSNWVGANVLLKPRPRHTPYKLMRLFRRHPNIRFEGKIHETIMPSILAVARNEGSIIGETTILIEHCGYEGDQANKNARNLPLLIEATQADPGRVYYWHHLAETFAALGRVDDAVHAAWCGIEFAIANPSPKSSADAAMLYHLVARSELSKGRDALPVLSEALARTPKNYALQLLMGQRHLAHGDPGEALAVADSLLAIDPISIPPGLMSYSEDIFGAFALRLRAAALMRLGRTKEAAVATARLLSDRDLPTAKNKIFW